MADKVWKQAERRVAKLFGVRRRTGSGCDYRTGADDLMHERLHIEIKYRQKHGVFSWWREILDALAQEQKKGNKKKSPVLVLVEKGSPVFLAVVPLEPKALRELADELERAGPSAYGSAPNDERTEPGVSP